MIYSMTGFGRSTVSEGPMKITVEAKSLNSKQLDLSLRLPSRYRDVEMKLRDEISKAVERGKVDVTIYAEPINDQAAAGELSTRINLSVVKALKKNISEVASELSVSEPVDWFQLFVRFPEVLHTDRPVPVASPDENKALFKCVGECLDNLSGFRATEGKTLENFLLARIDSIKGLLENIDVFEQERVAKIKDRIEEGLKKLQPVEFDRNRLEQELIFYIEKLDVSEEKQRLGQHIQYFRDTMAQPNPGQGKKLGFIAQEMGREINTLGSKSNHAEMQKIVVKMKDELEQIKEQVLNVM